MILDGVVSAAGKTLRDVCPAIPQILVGLNDRNVLLRSPRLASNGRVEVVVPTLTTLLTNASRQMAGDETPVLRSVFPHQCRNLGVFLRRPGSFDEFRVEDLLPAVQTLQVSSVGKVLRYGLPTFGSEGVNQVAEQAVFFRSPEVLGTAGTALAGRLAGERLHLSMTLGLRKAANFKFLAVGPRLACGLTQCLLPVFLS